MRVGDSGKPLTDYFNREISWLAFNARILALAGDPDVPLVERVRYLSIFATNLDEFFQVRVSGVSDQLAAEITERSFDGHTPAEQVEEIRRVTVELCSEQQSLFAEEIVPALRAEGIDFVSFDDLDEHETTHLKRHFEQRVFPVLTPLAVDPGHPFPFISDLSLNLAVLVRDPNDSKQCFARVKVPDTFGRWVPTAEGSSRLVALENVIAAHLELLFPGMELIEHHTFRVTRNADLTLNDEDAEDLLTAVEMELRRRRFQKAVRLEVADSMSAEVLGLLQRELDLGDDAVYPTSGPVDLGPLTEIANLPRSDLCWTPWRGITEPEVVTGEKGDVDIFGVLRSGELLVHHPYSSFSRSVGEFIHQAATDHDVLAIKITLYRTAGDSPIIDSLVLAAESGKQVAVLVELKARFDEALNISWAKRLEQAGAHVVYGLVGLKIHAKAAMVVREELDGIRLYCHIGTGNYNHRTARVYEDFGLLTANRAVGLEVAGLFNKLTGYGRSVDYRHLIVAPDQLRSRLVELIDQEMHALGGGRIVMKINALADGPIIDLLYKASQAGVQIDLIVRGLCSLRPGVPELSDNIRVRSIVGRFLEHSRIYHFANGAGPGKSATYIGSADVLPRNLNRRVEALVRITDEQLAARVLEVTDVLLADEHLAWSLDGDGLWTRQSGTTDSDTHMRLQQLALDRTRAG